MSEVDALKKIVNLMVDNYNYMKENEIYHTHYDDEVVNKIIDKINNTAFRGADNVCFSNDIPIDIENIDEFMMVKAFLISFLKNKVK